MFRPVARRTTNCISIGFAMLLSATVLSAANFTFVYTDTFTNQDALYLASGNTPVDFSGNTPFKVVATFDSATPDFHIPGFSAFVPTSAILTVGGKSYSMTNADVSIFDGSFTPGRYAAGFIENPAMDEAGFVADFSSVTTPFTVDNLVPTTFTNYNGTGFQPGSGTPPGCGASCTGHNNQPLTLIGSDGLNYLLTMDARDSGPDPAATASLCYATPEPAAGFLTLAGIAAVAGAALLAKKSAAL